MASNGRTMVSSKESVVFKVEQVIWPSTRYYFYKTGIPEKARCHGCRCVPHTIYPLENECQGHGLCRDCKEIDFTCHHHHGDVTAEAVRNAVGQANVAAKKLTLQCPFCKYYGPFLNMNDHIAKRHLKELADTLKSFQKTKDK
uniref:Uncharacterized protein n=1 Tax=Ixodes ricinus TaxID=34613 RepID=A0A0K8RIG2_IXORI